MVVATDGLPFLASPCLALPARLLQVRVGLSIHHSVQSVALDTLVEHRLGGEACKVGGCVRVCEGGHVRAACRLPASQGASTNPRSLSPVTNLLGLLRCAVQTVARWEKDRLRMQILEEAAIGGRAMGRAGAHCGGGVGGEGGAGRCRAQLQTDFTM